MWETMSPMFCIGRVVLHTPVEKLNLILHSSVLKCDIIKISMNQIFKCIVGRKKSIDHIKYT